MKTLICEEKSGIRVGEIPVPKYNEKQALVKTIACGICNGTDAKLIHHKFKGFPEELYPLTLGHEAVGEVVEVGAEVTTFKVGDKVLLPFVPEDLEYYGVHSAWGGYSEYGVVDDPACYEGYEGPECAYGQSVLPDDIDPVDATMIVTFREVLSSIRRFGMQAGKPVAVFGCGPVGLTFIRFMSWLGIGPIIAFDIIDEKLLLAKKIGADYTFNSGTCDPVAETRAICPDGVPYVLDAVGVTGLINTAMGMLTDQGKICCYGISPEMDMHLDWSQAPYNWTLQFQQFPSKIEEGEAHEQIIEWIREGRLNMKDYISDYFDFKNILDAFEKLEKKQIAKKGIIVYR
ncbi:MAG: zinc-binding dehydrogenase [Lachnospiraceae bacterium]|nr:zinc-binding dehydrogenase [Lachnospiraceae bacterium]